MISVSIMAHPRRRRMVQRLLYRLDAKPPVIWDRENDVWDTGRRALLAYDPGAQWHLVLQDDAVIPKGLMAGCRSLLEHVPSDVPVALYMGKARYRPHKYLMQPVVDAAQRVGASFAMFGGPWWGVGVILPTADIEAVVGFGDENPHNQPNYDLRIAQFYASKGIDCYYTMPSVVDHQAGPSMVGGRGSRRHALWALNGSLAEVDWSGGVVRPAEMKLTPRFPKTPT